MIVAFEPPESLLEMQKYNLIYFATPYTKYPAGIFQAYRDASRLAGRLVEYGLSIYSPIAHTHSLAIYGELNPLNHDMWMRFDRAMMRKSDALLVAKMQSWELSTGIAEEIVFFGTIGKPISYMNPTTLHVEEKVRH